MDPSLETAADGPSTPMENLTGARHKVNIDVERV
jgi:hypothetical protein